MNTTNHAERQAFTRYDGEHHLLYLNEKPATFAMPGSEEESGKEIEGFSYTGDMEDGSTIIEARDVTDDNRRAKYIAGLIGKRYTLDAQIAILTNGADTERHAEELREFEAHRATCKRDVDELLAR
jgi:hypothetical protein